MKLKIFCAWCGKFIRFEDLPQGQTPIRPVSHGICESCAKKINEEEPSMKDEENQ